MTDLRARAKELASDIGTMTWADEFGSHGLNYDDVEAALLAAFEAIRAEQIEADARIARETFATMGREAYIAEGPGGLVRRIFNAIRQAGEKK